MPYPYTHPLSGAFLVNRLDRLTDLITLQGEDLLRDAGLDVPSRAVSLMLLIGERGQISAADAASLLEHPHQLVTQRADVLLDLALIERKDDPADGRRKTLTLSAKGKDQHARLLVRLSQASVAFAQLSEEIGFDLAPLAARAIEALNRVPLLERINRNAAPARKKTSAAGRRAK